MQIFVEETEIPTVIQWERGMSDDEYFRLCADNPKLRIERTSQGDILIMPPAGFESGYRNNELNRQLGNWALSDGRGRAFDSNTAYVLPSGAVYSPDASWVQISRISALSPEEKRRFPRLCPDFVIELMSPSDRLSKLQAKMDEWIENGVQLGWLLDPDRRTAYVYRAGREPQCLVNPDRLIGEAPVGGLVLDLAGIWAEL